MTVERVVVLVVAVGVAVASAVLRNWWTFAAMVLLVLGSLNAAWHAKRAGRPKGGPPDGGSTEPHG